MTMGDRHFQNPWLKFNKSTVNLGKLIWNILRKDTSINAMWKCISNWHVVLILDDGIFVFRCAIHKGCIKSHNTSEQSHSGSSRLTQILTLSASACAHMSDIQISTLFCKWKHICPHVRYSNRRAVFPNQSLYVVKVTLVFNCDHTDGDL